jgi:mannose-6-phosphate isomerase-like protein (cupin superfamily)
MRRRRTGSLPLITLLCFAGSCRPAAHPSTDGPHAMAAGPPTPLVLAIDQGERRLRRFSYSAPQFTIKVDRRNGGSSDLVMGYEDLPPGGLIPPHWHRMADEIIFVHRGSGVVQLGDRRTAFGPGATIYIPRRVRVSVENTGTEPLGIAFIFSRPGFEELLRDISVAEGQPLVPLSAAELTAIRKRHEWHTVYERP